MRLFVAAQPPDDVLDALVEVVDDLRHRPDAESLRWVTREQLHVTLRFLGEVPDVAPVLESLSATQLPAAEAAATPGVTRLGRQVLCVPVAGVDALAAAITHVGPDEDRPFRGHLTLARARGRRGGVVDRSVAGSAVTGRWPVDDVRLVRSHLGSAGARYEVVHRRPLPT